MTITREHFVAVCEALGLDPARTVSVNITKDYVYIVHADRQLTSQPLDVDGEV